jgi:hypothetical protein
MNFIHNNPVLDAFDALDQLNEATSGQFQAVHTGSKYVPSEVRDRLYKEAYAEYEENLQKFKAELETISGVEIEQVDERSSIQHFNKENSTIGLASDGEYVCRVCYDSEEEPYYQNWTYIRSHFHAHVRIYLEIDGVSHYDYRDANGKHYGSLYDVMEVNASAAIVVEKACAKAEATLLNIAKKYFPNAEVKPTRIHQNVYYGTRIELDFTKDYDAARVKYDRLIAEYEVSDEEMEAEEQRIAKAITDYYASKKPGEYVGD